MKTRPNPEALRWRVERGDIRRLLQSTYVDADFTKFEEALAIAGGVEGINTGRVAAAIHGIDCPELTGPCFIVPPNASGRRPGAKRLLFPPERICVVEGIRVVDGLQMLVDLASDLDDLEWEQALESTLHRKLVTITAIESILLVLSRARAKGVATMRRVLELRPPGAPPTESLLETLMVQLARSVDAPIPTRQYRVYNEFGEFEARVDLCWPELGLFCELDGQHHRGQPVYDANRETRVVAATGWLCGRFTWKEVRHHPQPTGRRLLRLLDQARQRPFQVHRLG